ncbi:MAG: FMN-binding glutamate synthase family protein [Alphaproteobacteria bacterium]|nr:FMN-binding glutamate synthase family protein [Alphaproteobacteria bacterium]
MSTLFPIFELRFLPFLAAVVLTVAFAVAVAIQPHFAWLWIGFGVFGFFLLVGVHDIVQKRHAILRNYPIAAHLRFIFEEIRPELRQYFFEGDKDGTPFSRDRRAIVYQRAKKALDVRPFGTQYDVYASGYEWMAHSVAPRPVAKEPFRITVGNEACTKPYSASVFNISAMSFGSLSANAIRALNGGAKLGGFAHDTGEGGYSPYHREMGGDIIWEIGSGYFGCRNPDGTFSAEKFAEAAAGNDQIKMVELKLSQGAKPGHGGVLPAAKVSPEISLTRGVPTGQDCISPSSHSVFSTPVEMMQFIGEMRRLSGGKPAGFKLCIGHEWEFLAICKAMLETGIYPDFIVVDGKEGGTGAAPMEFLDHIGKPMRQGLYFVNNALIGIGARDRIKLGAAGKIITAFDIVRAMALGADWCNAARGYMFAVGCIQSQSCHTDRCPTGVATQDKNRQRALVVPDKLQRVANFHRGTLHELAELTAAAGLDHPNEFAPMHIWRRISPSEVVTFDEVYPSLRKGELLEGTNNPRWRGPWDMANPHSFRAAVA